MHVCAVRRPAVWGGGRAVCRPVPEGPPVLQQPCWWEPKPGLCHSLSHHEIQLQQCQRKCTITKWPITTKILLSSCEDQEYMKKKTFTISCMGSYIRFSINVKLILIWVHIKVQKCLLSLFLWRYAVAGSHLDLYFIFLALPLLLSFNVYSMSILSIPQKVSAEGCVSKYRAKRYVTVSSAMFRTPSN